MTTIQINAFVTVELTERTARNFRAYERAYNNARSAVANDCLDWSDIEDLWLEEREAWERLVK